MSEVEEGFDDILDTTDESEVAEPEVVTEPVTETVETKEETTEAEETKEVETKVETKDETTASEDKSWTFSQAMDERDKRQAAVKRADKLQEQLDALQPKEDDISIFTDEEGHNKQQEQKRREELFNQSLNMSEAFAEEAFGAEKVAAAKEWMKTEGIKSPYVVNQFNSAKLPYHAAVKLHEAEQARLNPEVHEAELTARITKKIMAELKGETKPEETITSSLATSRSSGDDKTVTENFGDLLNP